MFSEVGFSELPFSTLVAEFVEVGTSRFSFRGYTSHPSDTVPSSYFEQAVTQPASYTAQIGRGSLFGGFASSTLDVELTNADGSLDTFTTKSPVDGRSISIKVGLSDRSYDDFYKVFNSIMISSEDTEQSLRIRCSDRTRELKKVLQLSFYGGSGGADGGESLKDLPTPLCFGQVFHISPVLVDAATNLYQVHGGPVFDIQNVYDSGVLLTKVQEAPGGGQWLPDTASGTFILGANPAGLVTADVLGDSTPYYTSLFSRVLRRIVTDYSLAYDSDDLDEDSFLKLGVAVPATMGLYIGPQPVLVGDVIDELLRTVGCVGWYNFLGKFTVAAFDRPSGGVVASFDESNILRLTRSSPGGSMDPPIWKVKVGYARAYTPNNAPVDGASAEVREFVAREYRTVTVFDTNIQAKFLLAQETSLLPSPFSDISGATDVASRLLSLYRDRTSVFSVQVREAIFLIQLMSPVRLTFDRFGLGSGKVGRVIGMRLNLATGIAEYDVFI